MFPVRYVGYCAVVLGDYFINHEISGSQDPDSMESKWLQVFGGTVAHLEDGDLHCQYMGELSGFC